MFDAKTFEQTGLITKAHSMGAYDVYWLNDTQLFSSSADNTVKLWKMDGELSQTSEYDLL
mgnify:CR=1 FL=1